MNLLNFFARRSSAPVARDRLQVLLAHERAAVCGQSDLVAVLREEILTVIGKHIPIERENVQVTMDRRDGVSTLAVDIEVPMPVLPERPKAESPQAEPSKPEEAKVTRPRAARPKTERPKAEKPKPERSKSTAPKAEKPAEKPLEDTAVTGAPAATVSAP